MKPVISLPRSLLLVLLMSLAAGSAFAQAAKPSPSRPGAPASRPVGGFQPARQAPPPGQPTAQQPMRKASELINKQPPIVVNRAIYESLSPENAHVVVSLPKQRAYLLSGDQIAIDTPISSGKRAGMTPSGHFSVMEKDKDHRSSVYGDFKDRSGRTVRSGISVRIDSAPSGTHYVGAPMLWFMRLTGDGVGMHIGILPGYPASHGCIRMPAQSAEMFYNRVKVGTPVEVAN